MRMQAAEMSAMSAGGRPRCALPTLSAGRRQTAVRFGMYSPLQIIQPVMSVMKQQGILSEKDKVIDLVSYLICKRDKISKITINNTAGSGFNKIISDLWVDEVSVMLA